MTDKLAFIQIMIRVIDGPKIVLDLPVTDEVGQLLLLVFLIDYLKNQGIYRVYYFGISDVLKKNYRLP